MTYSRHKGKFHVVGGSHRFIMGWFSLNTNVLTVHPHRMVICVEKAVSVSIQVVQNYLILEPQVNLNLRTQYLHLFIIMLLM
jgi:hypothetical protein